MRHRFFSLLSLQTSVSRDKKILARLLSLSQVLIHPNLKEKNAMRTILGTLILSLSLPVVAAAQEAKPAPAAEAKAAAPAPAQKLSLITHGRFVYSVVGKMLVRSAELMPEEHYGFKPTDSVRTFGAIVGHVADSNYFFCSIALGEKNPLPRVEKTKSSKADLIAALNEALAYCDRAYAGMSETSAIDSVKMMGRDMPRLGVLNVNQNHSMEHYGNLVTYLRMNNIVPPSSDPEFMQKAAQ
jgi:uncharacterized damage-inducible protein DinB